MRFTLIRNKLRWELWARLFHERILENTLRYTEARWGTLRHMLRHVEVLWDLLRYVEVLHDTMSGRIGSGANELCSLNNCLVRQMKISLLVRQIVALLVTYNVVKQSESESRKMNNIHWILLKRDSTEFYWRVVQMVLRSWYQTDSVEQKGQLKRLMDLLLKRSFQVDLNASN